MRPPVATIAFLSGVMLAFAGPFDSLARDGWEFEVTPYMVAAGMDGTVGFNGVTTDIDVPFSDIVDHLDAGFMGLITARTGKWGFGLETLYMKLEGESSDTITASDGTVAGNGSVELTQSMTVLQGSAGYRVLDRKTKLDLIGALRYTELDTDMTITATFSPEVGFPSGSKSGSNSTGWTDVIAAFRVEHPLSPAVSLLGYADIGGGGSELTWQGVAGVNWEFARGVVAKSGYRYLYWDYDDKGTVWNVAASGPYLGVGMRF